jgi:hypothetical protein
MIQLKALLKRLAPSGPPLITGAVTAAVIYVANHVLHIHILSSAVESQLTPFVSFFLAAVVHQGTKVAPKVEADIKKVEGPAAPAIDSLVGLVAGAISARLDADPTLPDRLVGTALKALSEPAPVPAPTFPPAPPVVVQAPAPVVVAPVDTAGTPQQP